jgi:hypothetical protein
LKSYKSEHPSAPDTELLEDLAIDTGEVFFNTGIQPGFRVSTPHATVRDVHTKFEVTVSNTQTIIIVIDGIAQVSDANGNNTVSVNGGQKSTVLVDGVPTTPASFDPATVENWWDSILQPTLSSPPPPTPSPSTSLWQSTPTTPATYQVGSQLPASVASALPYLLICVAVIIIVVGLIVVQGKNRNKKLLPPPPPPPPD